MVVSFLIRASLLISHGGGGGRQLEGSKEKASRRKMTVSSYSFETEQESLKREKQKLLEGEFPEFRLKFLCDNILLTPT